MAEINTIKTHVTCEEIRYGKCVRSEFGPLQDGAPYEINSVTPHVADPMQYIPTNFLQNANITPHMFDQQHEHSGALIAKATEDGLAIMRIRYRAEAGEGESGRQFLLSNTLLLRNVDYWDQIPAGFFAWCEQNHRADPFIQGQNAKPDSRTIELPEYIQRDVSWYDGLDRNRQIQFGLTFKAIRQRTGWAVPDQMVQGQPSSSARGSAAAAIAGDLDVISSFPTRFALIDEKKDDFLLNLGLEPRVTPGAIAYFHGQDGGDFHPPDLQEIRTELFEHSITISETEEEHVKDLVIDSLDRRIGKDPIPLRSNISRIPY